MKLIETGTTQRGNSYSIVKHLEGTKQEYYMMRLANKDGMRLTGHTSKQLSYLRKQLENY